MRRHFNIITILMIANGITFTSCNKDYRLIVGGFTGKEGEKGLSVFDFNSRNGDLKLISEADVGTRSVIFLFFKKKRYVLCDERSHGVQGDIWRRTFNV